MIVKEWLESKTLSLFYINIEVVDKVTTISSSFLYWINYLETLYVLTNLHVTYLFIGVETREKYNVESNKTLVFLGV